MKKIFAKIIIWFILSIIACLIIYLISSLMHGSFNIREWSVSSRFITGFIMIVAMCVTGDEVSDLEE